APASSAIFACSALVTSMMTPPFSISASPTFSLSVPTSMNCLLDCSARMRSLLSQRPAQVGDQVVGILQPHRDADQPGADAHGGLLVFRDPSVRGARRVRP